MSEKCERVEKCGFFSNYEGNSQVMKAGWIKMFCTNFKNSAECKRKAVFLKTGHPPPDNMAPTGKML
jgi:hypothetical protein